MKSLGVRIVKRRGPWTPPWGTPTARGLEDNEEPAKETDKEWPGRWKENWKRMVPQKPREEATCFWEGGMISCEKCFWLAKQDEDQEYSVGSSNIEASSGPDKSLFSGQKLDWSGFKGEGEEKNCTRGI